MIEIEKGKRIEQILATDVTRDQLAEALWCTESSQRMWHGCAEENRNLRLKAEAENAELRQQLADVTESMGRVEERCAKLRELVLDTFAWLDGGTEYCESCDLAPECSEEYSEYCIMRDAFEQRMREPEIEVGPC